MIQASLDLSGCHYPISHAGYKETGTSLEAAESITHTIKQAHEDLLRLLKIHPQGLTADTAGKFLGWSPFYSRPRMSELKARGLVRKVGRSINDSGKAAYVWGIA